VILGLVTTQLAGATAPSDYLPLDWTACGLHKPSAYRTFLFTLPAEDVTVIGHLTVRDWDGVQTALNSGLATG
jgi:hypothetical protein